MKINEVQDRARGEASKTAFVAVNADHPGICRNADGAICGLKVTLVDAEGGMADMVLPLQEPVFGVNWSTQ